MDIDDVNKLDKAIDKSIKELLVLCNEGDEYWKISTPELDARCKLFHLLANKSVMGKKLIDVFPSGTSILHGEIGWQYGKEHFIHDIEFMDVSKYPAFIRFIRVIELKSTFWPGPAGRENENGKDLGALEAFGDEFKENYPDLPLRSYYIVIDNFNSTETKEKNTFNFIKDRINDENGIQLYYYEDGPKKYPR